MAQEHPSDVRSEDLRLLERRNLRLLGLLRLYRWCLVASLLLIAVLMVLLFYAKAPPLGRAILIDGKPVALVRNERAAAAVRQRLLGSAGGPGGRATFRETWGDETRRTDGERILSVSEAVRLLKGKVTVLREAFAIEESGHQLVILPSREMALTVLDRLKAKYASPSDAVVRKTRLQPEPAIRPCTVLPAEIVTDEAQAADLLTNARRQETYTVLAGDFPERIASAHGMAVRELWDLNPGLRGRSLHPGQQVRVLGRHSGLTVVTIKETVTTVAIPAGVRRQTTSELPRGQKRVAQPGRAGSKRVRWEVTMNDAREVSRRPLGEEVIAAPQPQLVLIGTK